MMDQQTWNILWFMIGGFILIALGLTMWIIHEYKKHDEWEE